MQHKKKKPQTNLKFPVKVSCLKEMLLLQAQSQILCILCNVDLVFAKQPGMGRSAELEIANTENGIRIKSVCVNDDIDSIIIGNIENFDSNKFIGAKTC